MSRIPKIEHSNHYSHSQWNEVDFNQFLKDRIDPSDGRFDESPGQLEKVERSIERTKYFCSQLTELLIMKGMLDFSEVHDLVGGSYKYRFDGEDRP